MEDVKYGENATYLLFRARNCRRYQWSFHIYPVWSRIVSHCCVFLSRSGRRSVCTETTHCRTAPLAEKHGSSVTSNKTSHTNTLAAKVSTRLVIFYFTLPEVNGSQHSSQIPAPCLRHCILIISMLGDIYVYIEQYTSPLIQTNMKFHNAGEHQNNNTGYSCLGQLPCSAPLECVGQPAIS